MIEAVGLVATVVPIAVCATAWLLVGAAAALDSLLGRRRSSTKSDGSVGKLATRRGVHIEEDATNT